MWFVNAPNHNIVYGYGVVCTHMHKRNDQEKRICNMFAIVCGFKRGCLNVCKRNTPLSLNYISVWMVYFSSFSGYLTPKPCLAALTIVHRKNKLRAGTLWLQPPRSMFALLIIAMCRTWNHQQVLIEKIGIIKTLKVSLRDIFWGLHHLKFWFTVNNLCIMKGSLVTFTICYNVWAGSKIYLIFIC